MIMVYGATGGIGEALCKRLKEDGTQVIAAGRNIDKLKTLATSLDIEYRQFNASDEVTNNDLEKVSHIINCSGHDVRKPLLNQNNDDINDQIRANLYAPIKLTRAFIRKNKNTEKLNSILHIGGFTDGSWPSYGYSVDTATRAALFSFLESTRLELDNSQLKIKYFCPLPTFTDAEKPYHKLWIQQGIKILPLNKVCDSIINTLKSKKDIVIMGNWFTRNSNILRRLLPFIFKPVITSMATQTKLFLQGDK